VLAASDEHLVWSGRLLDMINYQYIDLRFPVLQFQAELLTESRPKIKIVGGRYSRRLS